MTKTEQSLTRLQPADLQRRQLSSDGYRSLSLPELVNRIVQVADLRALTELHEFRPLFRFGGRNHLLLAEYVDCLREASARRARREDADAAYSLTVDKFSRLPIRTSGDDPGSEKTDNVGREHRNRIDCRHYFRAFLDAISSDGGASTALTPLEVELHAAAKLRGLVRRHYELSLRDCHRNGRMTRYVWVLPGGALRLLMPRLIAQNARRKWLETHFPDVDPTRPGERERVQEIIDAEAPRLADAATWAGATWLRAEHSTCEETALAGLSGGLLHGLPKTVAEEKVEAIDRQRPAIRALGPESLHRLILRIFDDLADSTFSDGEIAREFGLSKATFSRFAGSRWHMGDERNGPDGSPAIPDLWRNTAGVLAADEDMADVAREAGVWGSLRRATRTVDAAWSPAADLSFIPLIAAALDRPDREEALAELAKELRRTTSLRRSDRGRRQCQAFMAQCRREAPIRLGLLRDGVCLAELTVRRGQKPPGVGDLLPGQYALVLSTGRLCWHAGLQKEDLVASVNRAAAETRPGVAWPTREWSMFGEAMQVKLYAAMDGGRLEVEFADAD